MTLVQVAGTSATDFPSDVVALATSEKIVLAQHRMLNTVAPAAVLFGLHTFVVTSFSSHLMRFSASLPFVELSDERSLTRILETQLRTASRERESM